MNRILFKHKIINEVEFEKVANVENNTGLKIINFVDPETP